MSWGSLFSQMSGKGNMEVNVNDQASKPSFGSSASSALSGLNFYGDHPVSFEDFYHYYGYGENNPYGLAGRMQNWFTGNVSSAQQSYQNYLSDYEFRKNAEASAKANQETYDRQDSQIQRLMDDYSKAGVNPYLILSGGNLSSGVVSSESQKPSYKKRALEETKVDDRLMNTAIKVMALLLLKKAL